MNFFHVCKLFFCFFLNIDFFIFGIICFNFFFWQNSKSNKGQIKHLVYCMENAILNLPPDQDQLVWLIDFQGFSLSNISVKLTKETAHVLQEHYPERLGLAILYNPPKFFEPFWMVTFFHSSVSCFCFFMNIRRYLKLILAIQKYLSFT